MSEIVRWIKILTLTVPALCCSLIASAAVPRDAKTEIEILPFVQVPAGMNVKLGWLISHVDHQTVSTESIFDLSLFEGKSSGEKSFVGRIELARILRDKFEGNDSFIFKIPNQVVLAFQGGYVPSEDILRQVRNLKQGECPACEIEIRDFKITQQASPEELSSWELDFSNARLKGSVLVPLNLLTKTGKLLKAFVSLRILEKKQVFVSRKSLQLNEAINSADLETRWMDVTYLKESPAADADLKGAQLAKYVSAGNIVLAGDLKKMPAAVRGQGVRIQLGSEDLEVTVQGTAEETGIVGQSIRVKIPETQKVLTGQIIEPGLVKVE